MEPSAEPFYARFLDGTRSLLPRGDVMDGGYELAYERAG